jgi:hypothetical protein
MIPGDPVGKLYDSLGRCLLDSSDTCCKSVKRDDAGRQGNLRVWFNETPQTLLFPIVEEPHAGGHFWRLKAWIFGETPLPFNGLESSPLRAKRFYLPAAAFVQTRHVQFIVHVRPGQIRGAEPIKCQMRFINFPILGAVFGTSRTAAMTVYADALSAYLAAQRLGRGMRSASTTSENAGEGCRRLG